MEQCTHDLVEIHRTSNYCYSYVDEVVINWCNLCGSIITYIDHGDKEKEILDVREVAK